MCTIVYSQTYFVGEKTIIFNDVERTRNIETVVYYPSDIGGVDATIVDGSFPAIIFGHGTAMGDTDLYDYIWEAFASKGYVVLFPLSENDSPPLGAPDHEAFGLDLRFLNSQIIEENEDVESFFYGHITDKTAIIGHSLGGKGTLIAAANNTNITTIVTLCAALSDPPWPFAENGYDVVNNSIPYITVPALVVDAEFDCVVPEEEGHYLTYDLLDIDCKTYVNILGGGHCYVASSDGSACETAEGLFGGNCEGDFTITREEQNNIVLNIILPYFDYMLKDDEIALSEFLDYISGSLDVSYERDCFVSNSCDKSILDEIEIYPNPADRQIVLRIDTFDKEYLTLFRNI